ncbi:MAG TPA: PKD domain-containing protein [Chitinophagaceae bacterium]|nr:PKD domain-containing protein [Chitinophagaceae bacterium]
MRKVLLLLLLAVAASSVYSQDFSNKGKEFWIGYGNHVRMYQGNSQQMVLYITSDVNTTGTVEIPGIPWSTSFSVTANQITTINIPQAARLDSEGLSNMGIHVVAQRPVVVYGHIYNSAVSGATLCLPVTTLGREYVSINYTQVSNEGDSYSYFFIIATEDNTTVEITPKAPTLNGWSANTTYTVTLNKGQIYQVLSTVDLTGSNIKSVTGAGGGCKRIAVFCGSGKISIGCPTPSSSDNLFQQVYPTSTWGKKYITVSSHNNSNGDHRNFYRIIKSTPSAIVNLDGSFIPDAAFVGGLYYTFNGTGTHSISSDEPIQVAQYFTTQGCSGNPVPGDPEMIYLNPIEQTISNVTLFSSPFFQIDYHGLNVVVKTSGATSTALSSMKLDGSNIGHLFSVVPGEPEYSYAKIQVSPGTHNLTGDSGFNAIAFGFGNAESYGYSAGTNLKDLYQFITVQNDYSTVNFPAGCKNTPLRFAMTLPYQATQIKWVFGTALNSQGITDTTITAPVADSSWIVNGRTLYRYRLDRYSTINTAGTFPISVFANNPTATNGCSGEQEIQYDLQIFDQPIASFSTTHTGCLSDSVAFVDNTNGQGRPVTRWSWDFGDASYSNLKNPKHKYTTAGTYTVKMSAITDVGCLSDTAEQAVPISNPPVANFGISAATCAKDTITFTDQSNPLGSTLVEWRWDFGDGSPVLIKTDGNPVSHVYATPGQKTVTLTVKTSSGCTSVPYNRQITVNPKPLADFLLPAGICLPQGTAQFTDQSSISDGTQSQFTFLWNFGDGNTAATNNPVHNYTGVGPYNVRLQVTSNNGCVDDTIKVLSTIFAQPDALFNAPAEVCLSDSASFSDQSTASNSTVTQWFWDFGDGTTSNLQHPKKKWNTAGTYTVTLYIKSAAGCNSDTLGKQVVVNALPTASFTHSAPHCATRDITFTDASVPNAGTIVEWVWTFGTTQVVKNDGNPFTYSFATPGTYTVTLEVRTNKGCKSSVFSRTIVINPQPVVDFSMPSVCLPSGTGQFFDLSTISDGSQAQFTYLWDFGDNITSTQKDPVHQYTSAGPFTVTLTVTSKDNCVSTVSKQLTTIYPRPTANFDVTAEVCLGAPTSFSDQSNGNGSNVTRWRWDFGDGNTDTVRNPVHTYATAGTFTATLYIYTDKGCISDTATKLTVVNRLPQADFNFSNPTCATRSVNFTDISTPFAGSITKWNWVFGDGGTSIQQNPQHTFTAAGIYNVQLEVETDKGCKSSTPVTKQLTINHLPVPNFSLPNVCSSDPVAQFNDLSTIADGSEAQFTYLWNFGDPNANAGNPNTSTAKNGQHRYTVAGTYNVRLTVTSKDGCSKDTTIVFVVNGSLPQAGFSVNNSTDLCSNQDVTITDASSVDVGRLIRIEIYWDYLNDPTQKTVDDNPAAGKTYTFKYPEFGTPLTKTYQVRYVAYSGTTCLNQFTQTITLKASPEVQFNAMAGVCEEITPFQVVAASEIWSLAGTGTFSGNGISSTGLFSPATARPGLHTIRYTFNASNGCTTFKEQTIQVFPTPTVDAGPDRAVLEGGFVTLNAKVTGNNLSYLWTPSLGLDNPTIATPKVSPIDDTEYTLRVTSGNGCVAMDKVMVTLLKQLKVPNAFTPNGDGINDKWEILYLDSYPGCEVEVFNRYGQIVYKSVGYDKAWDGTRNGVALPVGTYYWIINPKNGRKAITGSVTIIR